MKFVSIAQLAEASKIATITNLFRHSDMLQNNAFFFRFLKAVNLDTIMAVLRIVCIVKAHYELKASQLL